MWLAGFSAEFLLSQPKLNKKFGWRVYSRSVTETIKSTGISAWTSVVRFLLHLLHDAFQGS